MPEGWSEVCREKPSKENKPEELQDSPTSPTDRRVIAPTAQERQIPTNRQRHRTWLRSGHAIIKTEGVQKTPVALEGDHQTAIFSSPPVLILI